MSNGTLAYAIQAAPGKDKPLRTAETTIKDDYNIIDGVINNGRQGKEQKKAKPSNQERPEEVNRDYAERKPPEKRCLDRSTPEHGDA